MTEQLILLVAGVISLATGVIVGYYARQSIAKRRAGTVEQKLQQKVNEAKEQADQIIVAAEQKAKEVAEGAKSEEEQRRRGFLKTEQVAFIPFN